MFYRLRYLCDGYILADAFRPNPQWGAKVFGIEGDISPPHTDEDIVKAATLQAPPGYWLQRVTAYGGEPHERDLYVKAVPMSRAAYDEKTTPTT